jgi:hypothetical protein
MIAIGLLARSLALCDSNGKKIGPSVDIERGTLLLWLYGIRNTKRIDSTLRSDSELRTTMPVLWFGMRHS